MKLSSSEITKLFKPVSNRPDRIYGREGKTVEYKQSFNYAGMARYFKTMASFANAEGGYIIFGIGDSPREYIGLLGKSKKQFDDLRIEEFTNNLNEYFQPEIKWEHTLFEYKSKEFGIIYTHELENKPCICSKNLDDGNERYSLKEGDIYYRYRARTEKIRYPELAKIFYDKEKKQTQLWMDLIQKTGKIGVENAALLDLTSGEIDTKHAKVVIDERILSQLCFIKEGDFSQKEGAPTLKLIGEIEGITPAEIIVTAKLRAIEQEDIINAFLIDENVESPFEYIKVALNCSSGFQPIYYFLSLSKKNPTYLINYIESEGRSSQTINIIKQRLEGRREDFIKLRNTGTEAYFGKREYLNKWLEFEISQVDFDILGDKEINWLLTAFLSIKDNYLIKNQKKYKGLLKEVYDKYFVGVKGNLASGFRKVLCRLDEVIFYNN